MLEVVYFFLGIYVQYIFSIYSTIRLNAGFTFRSYPMMRLPYDDGNGEEVPALFTGTGLERYPFNVPSSRYDFLR
jgi:hypothetical protein